MQSKAEHRWGPAPKAISRAHSDLSALPEAGQMLHVMFSCKGAHGTITMMAHGPACAVVVRGVDSAPTWCSGANHPAAGKGSLGAYVAQWHCVYCIQKGLLLNCCTSAAPSLPQKGSLLFRKMLPFQ